MEFKSTWIRNTHSKFQEDERLILQFHYLYSLSLVGPEEGCSQSSRHCAKVGVPLLIDPGMVERIEVVRGPVSVLYGAKALGGVVNIITKKGGDQPLQGHLSSSYNSANDGTNTVVSAFGYLNEFDYRISLTTNNQGDRHTPEGTVENTHYERRQLWDQCQSIIRRTSRWTVLRQLSIMPRKSMWNQTVRFTPPFLDFAIDAPRRDRKKSAIFYTMEPSWGRLTKISANAYRQVSDRQFNTFPSMLFPFPPPGMQTWYRHLFWIAPDDRWCPSAIRLAANLESLPDWRNSVQPWWSWSDTSQGNAD